MGRRELDFGDADAIGVAGLCGAVDPSLRAGDVVLATELRSEDGTTIPCPDSALLAEPLRRMGLKATTGTVYTASKILGRDERLALRDEGVIAVDMESAWIAEAAREPSGRRPARRRRHGRPPAREPAHARGRSPRPVDAAPGLRRLRRLGRGVLWTVLRARC